MIQHPVSRIRYPSLRLRCTSLLFLLLALASGLLSCQWQRILVISGRTMGTTYQVKTVAGPFTRTEALKKEIEERLEALNQSMSTYRSDSEISRFNAFSKTGEKFPVSPDFLKVMQISQQVYELTGGAWDGTVNPLVYLWGFHDHSAPPRIPTPEQIQALKSRVGFFHIKVLPDGYLVKDRGDVTVDLASDAKGFAVDEIALLLKRKGFHSLLVEIGGEVYAKGRKPDGTRWKIGISRPEPGSSLSSVYRVVELENRAMATSGDYRNFFEIDGKLYSHIIDPRTGAPVERRVVSASVQAATCALADALATALVVLPPEEGLGLVNRLPGVECLLVLHLPDGTLVDRSSPGFVYSVPES